MSAAFEQAGRSSSSLSVPKLLATKLRRWHQLPRFVVPPDSAPYDTSLNSLTALWLVSASCLVYEQPDTVRQVVTEVWECPRFRFFDDAATDTQAMAFGNGEFAVVCFRGTESSADWRTNLQKARVPFFTDEDDEWLRELDADFPFAAVQVHKGFNTALASVLPDIEAWLLADDGGGLAARPGTALYICGHSLGGALASLMFARLTLRRRPLHANGALTVGQPRVGNEAFARAMARFPRAVLQRVTNVNDVVPGVPPNIDGYKHYGKLIYFDRHGCLTRTAKQKNFDKTAAWMTGKSGVSAHSSLQYLQCIEKYYARACRKSGHVAIYKVELTAHAADGLLAGSGGGIDDVEQTVVYCQMQYHSEIQYSADAPAAQPAWQHAFVIPECAEHDSVTLAVYARPAAAAGAKPTPAGDTFLGQVELHLDQVVNFDSYQFELWPRAGLRTRHTIAGAVVLSAVFHLLRGAPEETLLKGTLILHGARGLKAADADGASDPYAVVKSGRHLCERTRVAHSTLAPVWEHQISLSSVNSNDVLDIEVWDHDRYNADDFLGHACIVLDRDGCDVVAQEVPLQPRSQADRGVTGCLLVSLFTTPVPRGGLSVARTTVTVHRAYGLRAADLNGLSDPYVVIRSPGIGEERALQFKTAVQPKTLNPVWEETFVVPKLVAGREITVQVWDRDRVGSDDFLGQVLLRFPSMAAVDHESYPLTGRKAKESKIITGSIVLSFDFAEPDLSLSSRSLSAVNESWLSSSLTGQEQEQRDEDSE